MNYPYFIPGSQTDPTAFTANTTLILGSYTKGVDMVSGLTVDYGKLTPAFTPVGYSIRVKPGGEPQLAIHNTLLTAEVLSLTLSGGVAGRSYEVTINAKDALGEVRSDVLTVNLLGDDCGCAPFIPLPPSGLVSSDGGIIVNDRPRFFVSSTFPVNPNVLDRWYDTTSGEIYDYVSDGLEAFWQIADSGGGGGGGSGATIVSLQPIFPDGVTTMFTLVAASRPVTVISSNTLFVSVDGVWQEPGIQYVAVNNQINFSQAPFADSKIFMVWFAPPGS